MNKEFLAQIGITGELLETISKEDLPEGTNLESLVESYRTSQKPVYKNLLKGEVDESVRTQLGRNAAKIEKIISETLGLSEIGVEINPEAGGISAALKLFKDHYEEKIKSGINDEEVKGMRERLGTLTNSIKQLEESRDSWKTKFETETDKLIREKEEVIKSIFRDRLFEEKFSAINWGVKEAMLSIVQDRIKEEIMSRYNIDEEGNLTSKDGGEALNFENTGVYTTLNQPIEYLVKKYDVTRKNTADGGGSGGQGGGGNIGGGRELPPNDGMSESAKAMLARMTQASKKRRR